MNRLTLPVVLILGCFVGLLGAPADAAPPNQVRILLVGVSQFDPRTSGVEALDGPPNDLAAVQSALAQRLVATSSLQMHTLLNQQATRAAILAEIRDFLGPLPAGGTAIFYFSGHGSRVYSPVPHKPDRYDSTLVPYDARVPGQANRDIHDVELGEALKSLDQRGVHVLVILDSCFSGGGTRGRGRPRMAPSVRLGTPNVVTESDASKNPETTPPSTETPTFAVIRGARHQQVVFSASEADAPAYESADGNGVVMGEFTRALVDGLQTGPRVMSYRELAFDIRTQLRTLRVDQSPHFEGVLDRLAFEAGGLGRGHLVIEAQRASAGHYSMSAGKLVGITQGSVYNAYDTASKAAFGTAAALATAVVGSVTLGDAELTITGSRLPQALFLAETTHRFDGELLRIWLADTIDGATRQQMNTKVAAVTGVVLAERKELAELTVEMNDGVLRSKDLAGFEVKIPVPSGTSRAEALISFLRSASRAKSLTALRQDDPTMDVGFTLMLVDKRTGGALEPEQHAGAYVAHAGDTIRVCLKNGRSKSKLHFYLLSLGGAYELHVLYPALEVGTDRPLGPGVSIPTDDIDVSESGTDRLKLIVTDAPIPAYVLERIDNEGRAAGPPPAQMSPLDHFLSDVAVGARIGPRPLLKNWTSREALVEVREASKAGALNVPTNCGP